MQQQIHYLHSLGADIVRFPIYVYAAPLDVWLAKVDSILPVCQSAQMVLVLTLHSGPAPHAPVESDPNFANWWGQISGHLRGQQQIWYDLANEPQDPNWRQIALAAAQRIRASDTQNHIVFAPRGTTTIPSSTTRPLDGIQRQIVTFHFYNWWDAVQSPTATSPYPSGSYTKANMSALLSEVANFRTRYNVPVYIGEVAIRENHPNAPRFLRDFTDLCDQLDIHLTVHAFEEAPVWNYESNPAAWLVLTTWLAR